MVVQNKLRIWHWLHGSGQAQRFPCSHAYTLSVSLLHWRIAREYSESSTYMLGVLF